LIRLRVAFEASCEASEAGAAKPYSTPLETLKDWVENPVGKLNRLEIRKPGVDRSRALVRQLRCHTFRVSASR
jgi:hypothetical protein